MIKEVEGEYDREGEHTRRGESEQEKQVKGTRHSQTPEEYARNDGCVVGKHIGRNTARMDSKRYAEWSLKGRQTGKRYAQVRRGAQRCRWKIKTNLGKEERCTGKRARRGYEWKIGLEGKYKGRDAGRDASSEARAEKEARIVLQTTNLPKRKNPG